MREKKRNKKGFTLAELLIVVAIIAVLVAIMIPVFGSSRANAIQSKDAANVRSLYSEAVTEAMQDESYSGSNIDITLDVKNVKDAKTTVTYDSTNNKLEVKTEGASTDPEVIDVDSDVTVHCTDSGIVNATAP